jgi:hypothetical protein
MMELDNGKYAIKQYNHSIGAIQNIWVKIRGDAEYIFTAEKDEKTVSGILKINGQDGIEIVEIYDYKVVGYSFLDGSSVYYNHDGILSYQNGTEPASCAIKEFMENGETIYDIFFLEDGSFIIGSTKTGPDYSANLLFGNGNLIHYFYYYHMKKDAQGNFKIKKIRTFGPLWKLEQLLL